MAKCHLFPILLTFDEHIHRILNQSFKALLDVSKDDSAFRVLEKCLQM